MRVRNAAQKARINERHREYRERIQEIKLERGCADCGRDDDPAALHFHHRHGEVKLFTIACSFGRRWSKVLAEMAKCDVLCWTCHGLHHAAEKRAVG